MNAADRPQGSTGEWREASEQEARQHPYYGLGGWLLLFLANVALIVVVGISELVAIARIQEGWSTYLAISTGTIVLRILLGAYTIYAALRLQSIFVKAAFAVVVVSALAVLLDAILLAITENYYLLKDQIFTMLLAEIIFVAWFLYLRSSERVNVTYLHRVRVKNSEPIG